MSLNLQGVDMSDVYTDNFNGSDWKNFIQSISYDEACREVALQSSAPRRRYIESRTLQDSAYAEFRQSAIKLIADVFSGAKSASYLQMAMTTSDFPTIFGDTMDRMLVNGYKRWDRTYTQYIWTNRLRDFRAAQRIDLYGGDEGLEEVPEGGEYPQDYLSERYYELQLAKYGRQLSITWEMVVNDDLGAFSRLPAVLGRAAAQAEHKFAVGLYAANATLYSATHDVDGTNYSNTGTQDLDQANLETYIIQAAKNGVDDKGDPVMNAMKKLVVPPALAITATKALSTVQATTTGAVNVIAGSLDIVVEPYLPVVDATNGHTGWYLFSEVSPESYAVEMVFLTGHEQPQLFEEISNAQAIGGGALHPQFNFQNDRKRYKVRHVYGGSHANAIGHWRYTFMSTGTA